MKKAHEDMIGLLLSLIFPPLIGFSVATAIYTEGVCFKTLFLVIGWLALTCVFWSLPSICQRFGKEKDVLRDERDINIFKNAALTADAVSWFYFLSACIIVWRLVGTDGSVSVNVLLLIFVGGIVIHQFTHVLSNFVQGKLGRSHG